MDSTRIAALSALVAIGVCSDTRAATYDVEANVNYNGEWYNFEAPEGDELTPFSGGDSDSGSIGPVDSMIQTVPQLDLEVEPGPFFGHGLIIEGSARASSIGFSRKTQAGLSVECCEGQTDWDSITANASASSSFSDSVFISEAVKSTSLYFDYTGSLAVGAFREVFVGIHPTTGEEIYELEPINPGDSILNDTEIYSQAVAQAFFGPAFALGSEMSDSEIEDLTWTEDGNTDVSRSLNLQLDLVLSDFGVAASRDLTITLLSGVTVSTRPTEGGFLLGGSSDFHSTLTLTGVQIFDENGNTLPLAGNFVSDTGIAYVAVPAPTPAALAFVASLALGRPRRLASPSRCS